MTDSFGKDAPKGTDSKPAVEANDRQAALAKKYPAMDKMGYLLAGGGYRTYQAETSIEQVENDLQEMEKDIKAYQAAMHAALKHDENLVERFSDRLKNQEQILISMMAAGPGIDPTAIKMQEYMLACLKKHLGLIQEYQMLTVKIQGFTDDILQNKSRIWAGLLKKKIQQHTSGPCDPTVTSNLIDVPPKKERAKLKDEQQKARKERMVLEAMIEAMALTKRAA